MGKSKEMSGGQKQPSANQRKAARRPEKPHWCKRAVWLGTLGTAGTAVLVGVLVNVLSTRVQRVVPPPSTPASPASDGVHEEYGKQHKRDRRSRRGGFRAVAALFMPGTLGPRLIFAFVIFGSLHFLPVYGWIRGTFVFFAAITAFIAADYASDKFDEAAATALFLLLGGLIVLAYLLDLLLTLAGNGLVHVSAPFTLPWGIVDWAEVVLLLTIIWLLAGVPHQAFLAGVDNKGTGDARRVLVGLIRAVACVMTGLYLALGHFGGGPLVSVPARPLTVGIIFTVVLVAPLYKSLAIAFWQSGAAGAIGYKALNRYWGTTGIEVRKEFDRSAASLTPPKTRGEQALEAVFSYKGLRNYFDIE